MVAALAAMLLCQAACGLLATTEGGTGSSSPGAGQGGSNTQGSKASSTKRPVLLVACLNDATFRQAAASIGAQGCTVIYQQEGETGGRLDETKLRRSISSKIPQGHTGWAMLDFEGHWTDFLNRTPEDPAFKKGEMALLTVIEVARDVRPTTRWTVYGIPNMPFFVKDDRGTIVGWDRGSAASKAAEIAKAKRAQRIVDACDWVSPSVYAPYSYEGNPEWRAALRAQVAAETEVARSMAGGKPVIPMIWHRIHDSNQRDGLALLSTEQWVEGTAKAVLAAGGDGVVWWGADEQMLVSGGLATRRKDEFGAIQGSGPQATRDYLRLIHLKKLQEIRPLFE